ncbi:hypothetical protein KQI38_13920 [Tissierella carlieri]|nr:hypothetical protein [Tissierella carlieri]MBU5313137.1 hypothetical protein [Tissierella carlieri]
MLIRKWCAENGVRPSQYYYWQRIVCNESLTLIPGESQVVQSPFAVVKVLETSNIYRILELSLLI